MRLSPKPNVCERNHSMCHPLGMITFIYCPPIEDIDASRAALDVHLARRRVPYVLTSDADAPAWDNGTCAVLRTSNLAMASAEPWCALAWMERRFMPPEGTRD